MTPAITRALNADPFAQAIAFQGRVLSRAEARAIERDVWLFRVMVRRRAV
jgi:pterin-4a-carbinolamine dehydratase